MEDQHASISLPDVSCPSDSVQISIAYPKTLDVGRRVCSSVAAHVSCWLGRSVELVSGLISIVVSTNVCSYVFHDSSPYAYLGL